MKHLDSEYRNHWEEYHFKDKVLDSREINWRDVPDWDKLEKLVLNVKGERYELIKKGLKGFKVFVRFRWGGIEYIDTIKHKINLWTFGWTDGKKCYLSDIDFHTGKKVKDYESTFEEFKQHIKL